MRIRILLFGLVALCFGGCATSDDPREGGLIGYLRHGEQGYQDRLDRRQIEVESVQQEAAAAQAESNRLRQRRDEIQAELARQRETLAALNVEIEEIRAAYATPGPELSVEAEAEQRQLVEDADGLQRRIQDLEQDPQMLVRERERRIAELSRELQLLREKASLLTAL